MNTQNGKAYHTTAQIFNIKDIIEKYKMKKTVILSKALYGAEYVSFLKREL